MRASSVLLVAGLLLLGFVSCAGQLDPVPSEPISILSDADFLEASGVTAGSGAKDDPFVIEGLVIDAGSGVGIRIQGTSAWVLVRGCVFSGDRRSGIGVLIGESARVIVDSCRFEGLRAGIFVQRTPDAAVTSCDFANCQRGVDASESAEIAVRDSWFDTSREHGVFLWRCHDAHLEGNRLLNGRNGIYLDSCHRAGLHRNEADGAERGIFLWDCFDCTVTENVFHACDLGFALVHTSERNAVYHNLFLENARAATCDEANNLWDDGYPSGGNYWGDPVDEDRSSGPLQDQPGPDGIADTPREVPFSGVDRYPLVVPPEGFEDRTKGEE